jgi:hypothetical protein
LLGTSASISATNDGSRDADLLGRARDGLASSSVASGVIASYARRGSA